MDLYSNTLGFTRMMVEELGIEDPNLQQQYVEEILTKLNQFMVRQLAWDEPAVMLEFNDLLERDPTPEAVSEFFATKVPNAEEWLARTCVKFRGKYYEEKQAEIEEENRVLRNKAAELEKKAADIESDDLEGQVKDLEEQLKELEEQLRIK